jgi:glucan phosphoethanolaminetransferase (alkaline phosphatase superfamily)
VWASEPYLKDHPERRQAMMTHLDRPLSHDHLFHSILDCSGVDSEAVDRRLSICAPAQ